METLYHTLKSAKEVTTSFVYNEHEVIIEISVSKDDTQTVTLKEVSGKVIHTEVNKGMHASALYIVNSLIPEVLEGYEFSEELSDIEMAEIMISYVKSSKAEAKGFGMSMDPMIMVMSTPLSHSKVSELGLISWASRLSGEENPPSESSLSTFWCDEVGSEIFKVRSAQGVLNKCKEWRKKHS